MLCQNCGKNLATTHMKKTINGETTELHLCAACAAKQGLNTVWNGLGLDLGNFWGSLFAEPAVREQADAVRCECCGSTFADIARSGRAGCPCCYTTFYDRAASLYPPHTRQNQAHRKGAQRRGRRSQKRKAAGRSPPPVSGEHRQSGIRKMCRAAGQHPRVGGGWTG